MRARYALLLALVLAAVPALIAADIKIKENPVPPHSFARVTLDGAPKGADVAWDITPEPVTVEERADGTLYFSGPPGTTYKVRADVIDWDAKKRTRYRADVVMGGAPVPPVPPDPQPEPGPGPQPKPEPITGTVARFVVVEDTAQAGAWRGQILGSPKVAAHYKSAKLTHRLLSTKAEFPDADPDAVLVTKAVATGKALPYLYTFDAAGKQLSEGPAPTDTPEAFLTAIGGGTRYPRKLGNREPPAGRTLKAGWKVFGQSPSVPLIPRDRWKPVDLSTFLPPVYDQDGRGQCNASATCTALEACRAQAGLPYVHLSAGDLYSLINDGVDQGSLLEDGLECALAAGVATARTVPYVWDGRRRADAATVAERKRFRAVECYVCPDFDALASALQQGFFIIEGLMWFDNFDPDGGGWLPARGAGGAGGHALCGYGLEQRGGTWGIKTRNSWSERWGVGGNCVIPESLFGRQIGGFWAVRSVVQSQAKTGRPLPRDTFAASRSRPFRALEGALGERDSGFALVW